jgi:hypothetical protein
LGQARGGTAHGRLTLKTAITQCKSYGRILSIMLQEKSTSAVATTARKRIFYSEKCNAFNIRNHE